MTVAYNINDTHKFQIDDIKILLDINSGSVHVIDDITWDIHDAMIKNGGNLEQALASLGNDYDAQALQDAKKDVLELAEQEMLFTSDEYRNQYRVPENPVLKSLCLHVSHDCNLRCMYCFASTGDFGGQRLLMSEEVGKKAIDFLIKNSGDRKHCEIDFFGGEPLMNLPIVKKLVDYAKEQGNKFGKILKLTLTTNAASLNEEVTEYLNQEEISVVLSIDGRPEVNDRARYFPNGKGSYEIINQNIKNFINSRNNDNYYVRGTFTGFNKDFSNDVKHLVEQGYGIVSVEPVVAADGEEYRLREEDLPALQEEYVKLAKYYYDMKQQGNPFTFFHFNLDLNHGPCLPKRLTGCGAGHEYMAVTPEGDLYPCHQFVGREEYKIGSLDVQELNEGLRKKFQQAHIYNKPQCSDCWARFYCSGGCHANAEAFHQDIYKPYELGCELEKTRVECAIWLQVKEALENN